VNRTESNIELLLKVAVYYYNENMTQQEIAGKLGITRQSVSKYLDMAKEQGIVEIKVKNPLPETAVLEDELVAGFAGSRLERVVVVPGNFSEYELIRRVIAQRACDYLEELLCVGNFRRIGLSWGRTVRDMVTQLPQICTEGRAEVVPLLGSTDNSIPYFMINDMAREFACKINGVTRQIFLPLDAECSEDYQHYTTTRQYRSLMDLWMHLDLAIVGIGANPLRTLSQRSHYPRESEIVESIEHRSPVGDICTRYYDIKGNILTSKSDFLISIRPEILTDIPRVIALAGGMDKIQSLAGAIRSGMITDIITDETTAKSLLALSRWP